MPLFLAVHPQVTATHGTTESCWALLLPLQRAREQSLGSQVAHLCTCDACLDTVPVPQPLSLGEQNYWGPAKDCPVSLLP